MARTSFYNDNANRNYPFLRDEELPTFVVTDVDEYTLDDIDDYVVTKDAGPVLVATIVDCGFMLGPGSGFVVGEHSVYMSEIERAGDFFIFTFKTDAPNLLTRSIRFVRSVDAERYEIEYADTLDNQDGSVSVSHTCDTADDFFGYLITGPLENLIALLPGDGLLTGSFNIEPALIQNLAQTYARSLNIANGDRTRYETPEGCSAQVWDTPPQELWIVSTCIQSPIRFKEGYNSHIAQDPDDNSITFSAIVAAGEGEACEQVAAYPGEAAPSDSLFFEGGPACNEVVRSINGVGGSVVDVKGGLGVRVLADPNNNQINIGVDTHDMAVCAASLS